MALLASGCAQPVCDAPSGACYGGELPDFTTVLADGGLLSPSDAASSDAASSDAASSADAGGAVPCQSDTDLSGITGVHIHIEGERCSFAYGQGGTFHYRVTVDRPLSYRVPASNSCGACRPYGANVQSLVQASVTNGPLSYCADCDLGCCPPNQEATYQLGAQSFDGTLEWPGRTWSGPSDTSAKPGDFFPAGSYFVMISVLLPDGGSALGKLPITIQ